MVVHEKNLIVTEMITIDVKSGGVLVSVEERKNPTPTRHGPLLEISQTLLREVQEIQAVIAMIGKPDFCNGQIYGRNSSGRYVLLQIPNMTMLRI